MHHVLHWVWWAWLQLWPNLAANVIWVPVAWLHHVLSRRHTAKLQAEHAKTVQELHGKIDDLTRRVTGDEPAGN